MNLFELGATLGLDSSDYDKGLKESEKTTKSFQQKVGDMGTSMQNIGKKFIGASVAVGAFVGGSIAAANSLEQTQRKTQVIFGNMTKEVQDWSLENERVFGLGAGTIEGYTGQIADLAQGLGMGKKESLEFSKGAMEIGVQLGNWAGVGADEAMNDLQSALMGSHRAMEKYGVKLNKTVLDEYTRSSGLGDTFDKLTEAEKAQVRYNAIVGSSGNAIKNWKDGNRSLKFTMQEIKEQITNIMEVVGKIFLPIVQNVVKKIADWTAKVAALASENPELVTTIVSIVTALATLPPILIVVGKAMALFGGASAGVVVALGVIAGVIGFLGIAFIGLDENFRNYISELPFKVAGAIREILQKIVEGLPLFLEKALEIAMKLLEGFALGLPVFIQFVVDSILQLIGMIFQFAPKFLEIGLDFIVKMLDGAIQKFPQFLQFMIDGILKVLENIKAELPEFLENGIAFIAKMIQGIAQKMPEIISKIFQLVRSLINKLIENLPQFLRQGIEIVAKLIAGIWQNRGKILEAGKDIVKAGLDGIKSVISGFFDIGKDIVKGVWNGITNMGSWLGEKITGFFSGMVTKAKKTLGIHSPSRVFRDVIGKQIPAGVEVGIEQGMPNLERTLDKEMFGLTQGYDFNANINPIGQNTPKNVKIELRIENFVNNTKADIEEITEQIAFSIEKKRYALGGI